MTEFRKMLCVVDTEASTHPVLRRGAWLAKHTGATIQLLAVSYNDYLVSHPLFDDRLVLLAQDESSRAVKEQLEKLAEPLRESEIDVKTVVVWDHPPHEAIVRQASRSQVDIVLKDTHHHTVFDLVTLSNTDWSLIRACPMPLWLVKDHDFPEIPRVLAAIDPLHKHDKSASLDEMILGLMQSVTTAIGGEAHAFHCYDSRLKFSINALSALLPDSVRNEDLRQRLEQQHEERFRQVIEPYGIPQDRAHLMTGYVHQQLPALAKSLEAAIVVLGAVNRNPLKRLLIGSTAEHTLDRLPCDLLIVKPDSFETPVELNAHESA